jgi:GR25 family glycosyltransferase involved in LPS biosynthesis
MKTNIIRLQNDIDSNKYANWCWQTSAVNTSIEFFNAVTPDEVDDLMSGLRIEWKYPWTGEVNDIKSGLTLRAYQTADPKKRMACFLSHYWLWEKTIKSGEPMLILEHDAMFISKKPIPFDDILDSGFEIIGINEPFGATRLSQVFHENVQKEHFCKNDVVRAPLIDDIKVPQGIAGNSAYIITPKGAYTMIKLTKEHGAWPNDALMCRQLIFGLGVTKTYYTKIQRIRSTTTL